jgi:hypothetical protein
MTQSGPKSNEDERISSEDSRIEWEPPILRRLATREADAHPSTHRDSASTDERMLSS